MKKFIAAIVSGATNQPIGLLPELPNTRLTKAAKLLLVSDAILLAITPLLVIAGLILLNSVCVVAQTPGGGGIFGADAETAGTGLREVIKWLRNIMFLVGVGLFCLSGWKYYQEESLKKPLVGGALCMGAWAILATLAYRFSRGEAVNVDTQLDS